MLWLWSMQPLTLPCEMPVLPAVVAGDGLAEAILPSAVPTVTFLELPLHLARRRRRQRSTRMLAESLEPVLRATRMF